ncbi:MAG: DUF3604 domain-containing protein [Opitutae bacterium]|nr:DUF3604 domain-containing protein [Opitutae bacterium]
MSYDLYWGDLHSHCSISYGHGSIEQALERARQQLDFCSIAGHAFWPDMPTDRNRYAEIIDYHNEGFARCAKNWSKLIESHKRTTVAGEFVALPSYEWHSLEYGDHNVYCPQADLPLRDAPDLPALRKLARAVDGIAIPHHIGYRKGYRGINWDAYREEVSPFVEVFSLHGCSLGADAAYPMLHDMGPRDFGSTAEEGWRRGHKFGIVGGTDHHAAYPGSHGDGRMGVFAETLTRQRLVEAFKARRVYAATGDKIDARLFINDAWIGQTVKAPGARNLQISVLGMDELDQVRLLKNGRILGRYFPTVEGSDSNRYRLRLTWGWGRKTERNNKSVAWRSVTSGNLSMRHATTQGISLEIEASRDAEMRVNVNGRTFRHKLAEILEGGRSHFLRGWLTEAIQIGPAVPLNLCRVEETLTDKPKKKMDIYRLEVAQKNGQWAWLTPIWAEA